MSWLASHWPDLVQNAVIVGGLVLGIWTAYQERQARRSGTLLKLTEQHRDLWREMLTRDELSRVLTADADLSAEPLSKDETVFATLLFLHLNAAYDAIRAGVLKEPEGLTLDIRTFFSLPVPASCWTQMRHLHDAGFVAFVEERRAIT